jgi:hypothetical protein
MLLYKKHKYCHLFEACVTIDGLWIGWLDLLNLYNQLVAKSNRDTMVISAVYSSLSLTD